MYGTQAIVVVRNVIRMFENDVKMYGTQAARATWCCLDGFENDVKMYGTQANNWAGNSALGLRMM